jgi:hypothetical protein
MFAKIAERGSRLSVVGFYNSIFINKFFGKFVSSPLLPSMCVSMVKTSLVITNSW